MEGNRGDCESCTAGKGMEVRRSQLEVSGDLGAGSITLHPPISRLTGVVVSMDGDQDMQLVTP